MEGNRTGAWLGTFMLSSPWRAAARAGGMFFARPSRPPPPRMNGTGTPPTALPKDHHLPTCDAPSYKLIARETVEEKILNLQERKRALLQGVLGDEDAWAGSLTWEEVQSLLE